MNYDEHAKAVTSKLIEMITAGNAGEWSMPWHTHGFGDHLRARNATTGVRYQGGNILTLALAGIDRGFPTGQWATYRQWQSIDAQVRKGERSTQVVKWIAKKSDDAEDPRSNRSSGPSAERLGGRRLIPRVYAVFNRHQVDGYDDTDSQTEDQADVGEWLAGIGADVVYGGDRAYYMVAADRIYTPGIEQYSDPVAHYGTVIHEHIHWTGHRSRLDRDGLGHPFGSVEYAGEELVAELGSAIACAGLGIETEPRRDHTAYLAHWLDILNADPKALFRSASAAQRAVDLLEALSTGADNEAIDTTLVGHARGCGEGRPLVQGRG